MATRQKILPPVGKLMPVYYNESQSKAQLVSDVLLPIWENYCNENWLSGNHEDPQCPETRVKKFLDGLAYLLLRDKPEDTLTTYKEMARGRSEIPVSSCPAFMHDMIYGDGPVLGTAPDTSDASFQTLLEYVDERARVNGYKDTAKKKPAQRKRVDRAQAIRDAYPGCSFTLCRVDTENRFEYRGTLYRIHESVSVYQPKQTREGLLYDMDRVAVVRSTDGMLHFFDQRYDAMEDGAVAPVPDA